MTSAVLGRIGDPTGFSLDRLAVAQAAPGYPEVTRPIAPMARQTRFTTSSATQSVPSLGGKLRARRLARKQAWLARPKFR